MVTERRAIRWAPIILQTIVMIAAVVGFAIANEHRITILEECSKTAAEALKKTNDSTAEAFRKTNDRLDAMQQIQIRTIALLESIERRHMREDDHR